MNIIPKHTISEKTKPCIVKHEHQNLSTCPIVLLETPTSACYLFPGTNKKVRINEIFAHTYRTLNKKQRIFYSESYRNNINSTHVQAYGPRSEVLAT